MNCVYCGAERNKGGLHQCYGSKEDIDRVENNKAINIILKKMCDAIQDLSNNLLTLTTCTQGILEEIERANKSIEIDDIPDQILTLQELYNDYKEKP